MNQNTYVNINSWIHQLNPSIKFIALILFVASIFIPFGFLYQFVLLGIGLVIYFSSKLPIKKLLKLFIPIVIMFCILLIINWLTYKSPGLIFDLYNSNNFVVKQNWINASNVIELDGKYFVQGQLWGSTFYEDASNIFLNNGAYVKNSGNGFYIIENISSDDIFNKIINDISNNNLRYEYFQFSNSSYYFYLYTKNSYSFSSYAITFAVYVSMKILLMILLITIFTSTTSPMQITFAIEYILYPLKYIKVPVSEIALIISLAIRFVPSLLEESNRIFKAQASKGIDFRNGNIFDKFKSLTSLIIPLFSIAFKKAEELSYAMQTRGYDPKNKRTRYRSYKINFIDICYLIFFILLLATTICLISIQGKAIIVSTWIYDCIQILN